jgi:small conductance mechanosensitive channel
MALAMQGVLGNVAAGLTIIFTQPFHVGDYISIGSEEGEVLDISLFSTTLGHTRPLEGRHPEPQDRRRDPAQLRPDPPARHMRWGVPTAPTSTSRWAWSDDILRANPRVLQSIRQPVIGVARLAESGVTISVNVRGSACPTTLRGRQRRSTRPSWRPSARGTSSSPCRNTK